MFQNFNPAANSNVGCVYPEMGCMETTATNYDAAAQQQPDGVCLYRDTNPLGWAGVNTCQWADDGYCDADKDECTACTDVSDCGYCDANFDYGADTCEAPDSDGSVLQLALDGLCDEPAFSIGTSRCANGTDASDCAVCDGLWLDLQDAGTATDCGHGRCQFDEFAQCVCDPVQRARKSL